MTTTDNHAAPGGAGGLGTRPIEVVQRLYAAYNRRDVDAALRCWQDGGVEHWPFAGELRAPDQLGAHLRGFYAAFPDATIEVHEFLESPDGRVAAQVTLSGTFTGAPFYGFRANGRAWHTRMAEFFVVRDGLIAQLHVHWDFMGLAQQIGLLPPSGSRMESMMRAAFNARARLARRYRAGAGTGR